MNRTKAIMAIIIFLLLAACILYISIIPDKENANMDAVARETGNAASEASITGNGEPDTTGYETALEDMAPDGTAELIHSEEIAVEYNSPEYDLVMTLTEDNRKNTVLRLEYYYDGAGMVKTYDTADIPEIDGIFEKRAESGLNEDGYKIEAAYLNAKLAKVYFIVSGGGIADNVQNDMYVVLLADAGIKKVFSNRGIYGKMSFCKNQKYLAYSYNDPMTSSVLQESSLLEVIDCSTDTFIVKNSRTGEGKRIGSNLEPEAVFDYTFKGWYSNDTVRLLQKTIPDEEAGELEVRYDISRDLMLDRNGDEITHAGEIPVNGAEKPEDTGENGETGKTGKTGETDETDEPDGTDPALVESEALKVLKEFYSCLASREDYQKAMELLDETFVIRLKIFRQFGISELTKKDISADNASFYSDMLRAASFDGKVLEESVDGASTIYYYQMMELSEGNQIRQPMSVRINRTEKGWRITLLEDVDGNRPPFAGSESSDADTASE